MYEKTPCDVTACRGEYIKTALRSECNVLIDWNDIGVSSAVRARKLQPGQSVKDLAEEISNAANRYFNKGNSKNAEICTLTEKMKFSKFLESLRPDIRTQVKILGPSSFEEAVKQACNAEIAFNDTAAASSNVFTTAEVNILLVNHFESSKKIEELNKRMKT
ncbi:hypothetical protein AVEN_111703-1 [Araneus ventricosus]|uniref:Uncharacterized protein n=1 Tax=Araneus ventricosus TaxID=182803 RepID=A0A4Y2C9Y1_ARAVE|nr:hypothetical protein AVEN_111703-1 [Araneus ventricosus]